MRWHAQVTHIVRKDLWFIRWGVVVYALVVAAVVWSVSATVTGGFAQLGTLLVALCGMLIVATLVQADSPFRTDAFWRSHPFAVSAVVAGKAVSTLVVVVGIGLAGQLMAFLMHDIAAGQLVDLLEVSAVTSVRWLVVPGIVAALTRELRAFLLAMIVYLILLQIVGALVMYELRPDPRVMSPEYATTMRWMTIVGGALIVANQYRDPGRVRGAVLAGLLVFGLPIAGALWPAPNRRAPADARGDASPIDTVLPGLRASIDASLLPAGERVAPAGPRRSGTYIDLSLSGGSEGHGYSLSDIEVRVRLPDGSTAPFPVDRAALWLDKPRPALEPGMAWVWAGANRARARLRFEPGERTQSNVAATPRGTSPPEADLFLTGKVEIWEPRIQASAPLRPGATFTNAGVRFRIDAIDEFPDPISIQVASSAIKHPPAALPIPPTSVEPEHALLDPGSGQAIVMGTSGGRSSGLGLVLPGPEVILYTRTLEVPAVVARTSLRPLTLGDDARLITFDYARVGSYLINVRLSTSR